MAKLLIALALITLGTSAYAENCKVIAVSDGDTITCLNTNQAQFKVRLNQIDAPESHQSFGTQSKKALSDLVFGKIVEIKSTGTDKYGRTLGEIYIDNVNVNKKQVANGMAWSYREYLTDQDYLVLESNARARKIGIWSEPNPVYPSDFRKQARPVSDSTPVHNSTPSIVNRATNGSFSCSVRKTCGQINTCAEARHQLNVCGNSSLDRDKDGVPCESLCR